jgi:hypothetical protein
MKRSLAVTLTLIVSATNGYSQAGDFLNLVGGIMNQAMQNERAREGARNYPPPRREYRESVEDEPVARRAPSVPVERPSAKASWTVVMVNGSTIATEPNGLSLGHNPAGALYLSLAAKTPLAVQSPAAQVNFVFNGQFFGTLPGRIQGSSIIIDDQNSLPALLSSLKSRNSFEITSANLRLAGSLSGASKAIEQVEQAARVAVTVNNAAQAGAAQAGSVTITNTTINTGANASDATAALSEVDREALEKTADGVANLTAQVALLQQVVENQRQMLPQAPQDQKLTIEATIQVINSNIEEKKKDLKQADVKLQGYLTSITPNNRNQYLSARKASEIYPKVPFYIPGTTEIGEFWVEPFVTDKGEQRFKFHFIDREALNDVKRDTIEMDRDQMAQVQQGLFKLYEWSEKAQNEKIRKIFSKRAVCFPAADCPTDGEKGELGKSSTEIRFQIYEDGSTAGRIQRNKGRFEEGYNVSIDSAMLLQAYASFVLKESDFDYKSGTQSTKDLHDLFS